MMWFSVFLVVFAASSAVVEAQNFRWCCIQDEMKKCEDFSNALPGIIKIAGVSQSVTGGCVSGTNEEDCIKKIKNNEADFVSLSAGYVLTAGKDYDLVPIVAEDSQTPSGMGYYGVIVAKKSTKVTFSTLKGKKSCHTGYRRNAGWNIPIGYLLHNTVQGKNNSGCDAQFASNFFSKSCVPGAPQRKGLENLCALCPKGSNCVSDSKNTYSGYRGAFHCMADGVGDVAFVKHVTTADVLSYASDKYGNMSDYKYICPDGTTKEVTADAYKSCNLGRRPSDVVVTRSSGDNVNFIKILTTASKYCQPNTTASNCSGFLIFDSSKYGSEKKNLLFRDSTKRLVDIGDQNSYKKWLGDDYIHALQVQGGPTCTGTNINPTTVIPVGTGVTISSSLSSLLIVLIILGAILI